MWTKDSVFCLLLSNGSRLPSATSVCGCRFSSFTCPFDLWPEWSNSSWRRTTSEWMTEVEFTRTYTETRWRGGCCCGPVVVLKEARMNIWRTRVFNHHTRTGFDPFPGMFPSSSLLSSTHSRPHMDTGATSTVHYQQHGTALLCAWCSPGDCGRTPSRRCLNGNISEISHLHQLGSSAIAARDFTPIIKGHTCWGCE